MHLRHRVSEINFIVILLLFNSKCLLIFKTYSDSQTVASFNVFTVHNPRNKHLNLVALLDPTDEILVNLMKCFAEKLKSHECSISYGTNEIKLCDALLVPFVARTRIVEDARSVLHEQKAHLSGN